ncbi:B-cadherin [Sinocyclocheilus anshuiensis]|uniref:B-cadherin n=1 Tax=Sinocyclocheilus anshuiensis TaxID=1608454 RepID=UPI0007B7A306|nr:PREDICTED: B-cadherin-like [Sinocyclocheilus anshuiensis]
MKRFTHGSFICVLCLMVFSEIIPEYLAAIQLGQFMLDKRNSSTLWQNSTTPGSHYVSMTVIPKTSNSMIRRKRAWLIPPVSISENDKGPFPKEVVKMKSTAAASINAALIYKITGPGADQPPKGLFRVDKYSGMLWVTKGLDREETEEYTITIHASAEDQSYTETPVKLTIKVIDQNDNKPLCTQNPFMGEVLERAKQYVPVIQVTAKDIDDPETANGIVRYKLVRQEPNGGVFRIDPASGVISLATRGVLDRETQTVYKLAVEAADMDGHGLSSTCVVIINITDSNDHAPKFSQRKYAGTVQENKAGEIVARLDVTDRDEPLTVNSVAKFTIIQGNEKGFFNISTGPSGMEGIITTSKGLNFEQANSFSLLVVVENEVPFAVPLVTSNATITITVQDVNEPPVFEPAEKQIMILEDLAVGSTISKYTANDPDTAREQKIRYKLLQDFANWLEITEDTGVIRVRSSLDREASFIRNEQYTVLVLAYDNDDEPTTGTGTLVIKLLDVNDNAPVLEERRVPMCLKEPKTVRLTITDPDGPENGPPFIIELHKEYQSNWTIIRNSSSSLVWLNPLRRLALGDYSLVLRVYDSKMLFQDSSVIVEVCDCKGDDVTCFSGIYAAAAAAAADITLSIYVLAAILSFLVLLLLLLLLKRRCGRKVQWEQFSQTEEDRDNILCYNEEGGGEQDQDFDMVLLCSRPEVFSTFIAPTASPMVFYRQHPDENEDIENFIYENLCTEDDDHYVVPYDSVLVFAHEGEGSEAGSLSSLQSSISDGDQDFQHLQNWGPQFRRLADMYAGGEDNI